MLCAIEREEEIWEDKVLKAGNKALTVSKLSSRNDGFVVINMIIVLVAMMLQLELTQEAWGTYHYSCSDPVIGFQFIESIVAQASQFDARLVPSDIRFAHLADPCDAFYFEPVILKCDKIRSVFGIHQKTWRSYLSDTVKQYFAQSKSVEPIYE